FSLLQRGHPIIRKRISTMKAEETALTIISAEEQIRGRLNIIRRANSSNEIVLAYQRLRDCLDDLRNINLLDFTSDASVVYDDLVRQRIRIGTRDLRIAAISLTVKGILVTRNQGDFEKIPGLPFEDWSVEIRS
ncbi:MAG: type II toxin-antitoxin system VapC family toxin, partial [Microcystaceae cyanobacterium]